VADLVFIHGAGEDGRIWDRQVAALGASHRVLAVDLPGRGPRRAEPALDTHAANARDVVARMDRAGIARAVVVGHSMGGGVALTLALEHPGRLAGLVLVVSGARLKMHPDFLDKARRRAEDPAAPAEPPVPLERTVAPGTPPAVLDWLAERAMTAPPATVYADFRANNAFDVMDRLPAITIPTLVLGATEDRMAPPKFSEFMAERIPGAELVILPSAGHYPQVEQEALFNQALQAFLLRLR
jgi:pimeloyl-ACP methyl ester carboxylesterase